MFLPPGFLDDFSSQAAREAWHRQIDGHVVTAIAQRKPALAAPPFLARAGAVLTSPSDTIQWAGEPRRFFKYINAPPARIMDYLDWTGAGGLQFGRAFAQEEYLEWRTVRDAAGRIASVEMSCESIEYWSLMAQYEPRRLVQLTGEMSGVAESKIDLEDLFGTDDPYSAEPESLAGRMRGTAHLQRSQHTGGEPCISKYNNGIAGILHMGVTPNALAAAITLAVWAAYPLDNGNGPMTGEEAATTGTQNVQSCRSSDPSICEKIIAVVHGGNRVALANPVGIYMVPFPRGLVRLGGAELPEDWLHYSRGSAARDDSGGNPTWQRLVIRPPAGSGKRIEDLKDHRGNPITTGAQLACLQSVTILSQSAVDAEAIAPLRLQFDTPDKCNLAHPDAASLQEHFDRFMREKEAVLQVTRLRSGARPA